MINLNKYFYVKRKYDIYTFELSLTLDYAI